MDESKLNMSKLASESGHQAARSGSEKQDYHTESLKLSRMGGVSGDPGETVSGIRTESRLYQEARRCLTAAFDAARGKRAFSPDPTVAVMKKIVDAGKQETEALFLTAIHDDYRDDFVVYHSVNTAILAVMIGNQLGITGAGLVKLGSAALLHDIGTALVPDDIFLKPSPLTTSEMSQIRQRPLYSRQILSQLEKPTAYLPEIAGQVYERLDGSGYPSGLKGADLHAYSLIIGLVDWYEALVHSRPHRDRILHFSAIKEILRSGKYCFERRHLKALINTVSLFPSLSFVRLNSGAVGRVMETDPRYPLRPRVKVLYDAQRRPVSSERLVDLRENTLLFIADAVTLEESGDVSV